MENNLKTQGFVLLDVDVVALNNADIINSSTLKRRDNPQKHRLVKYHRKGFWFVGLHTFSLAAGKDYCTIVHYKTSQTDKICIKFVRQLHNKTQYYYRIKITNFK